MRVLGVGNSCDLGDLYLRLSAVGHEVRVYSRDFAEHTVMAGMLPHVPDWHDQLDWIRAARDDGVILFETAEHGAEQDRLRHDGFRVIGGSSLGDRLENDRAYAQRVFAELGFATARTYVFDDFERAIAFVRAEPRRYVFKLNGSETSSWRNYVGQAQDGSDMLGLLRGQATRFAAADIHQKSFVLMEYVTGIETGVGAYFNGKEFLTPACLDWEHKHFFNGDIGELTCEMGTLVTYEDTERLFSLTLAKLAPLLRQGGYVGYINLNTIIDERGIWPLELTCRFGYPGFAILSALQRCGWAEVLQGMLQGATRLPTAPGYAVGVVLTVPPFPYRYGYAEISRGLPIVLDPALSEREQARLHWGEVARDGRGQLVTSGTTGYVGVATGTGLTVEIAQAEAYALAKRVYVPNLRYRTDIGDAFVDHGRARLRELGYLG